MEVGWGRDGLLTLFDLYCRGDRIHRISDTVESTEEHVTAGTVGGGFNWIDWIVLRDTFGFRSPTTKPVDGEKSLLRAESLCCFVLGKPACLVRGIFS